MSINSMCFTNSKEFYRFWLYYAIIPLIIAALIVLWGILSTDDCRKENNMTVSDVARVIGNQHSFVNSPIRIEDTVIDMRIMPSKRNKGMALVTNKANPYGVYIYEDGDVRTLSDIDDILPILPEQEQDKWVINTFGIFR